MAEVCVAGRIVLAESLTVERDQQCFVQALSQFSSPAKRRKLGFACDDAEGMYSGHLAWVEAPSRVRRCDSRRQRLILQAELLLAKRARQEAHGSKAAKP